MHLPLYTLLPFLLLLLPLAHTSPTPPHPKRQLICNPTPSPHLLYADCLRALTNMPVPQPSIDYHPSDLSVLTLLRASGPPDSPNRLPRSFVAGTCRVDVQFVNGVGVMRMLWAEVMARALNVVDLCVDAEVPKGGTSRFGFLRVVVEEVGAGARVGVQ